MPKTKEKLTNMKKPWFLANQSISFYILDKKLRRIRKYLKSDYFNKTVKENTAIIANRNNPVGGNQNIIHNTEAIDIAFKPLRVMFEDFIRTVYMAMYFENKVKYYSHERDIFEKVFIKKYFFNVATKEDWYSTYELLLGLRRAEEAEKNHQKVLKGNLKNLTTKHWDSLCDYFMNKQEKFLDYIGIVTTLAFSFSDEEVHSGKLLIQEYKAIKQLSSFEKIDEYIDPMPKKLKDDLKMLLKEETSLLVKTEQTIQELWTLIHALTKTTAYKVEMRKLRKVCVKFSTTNWFELLIDTTVDDTKMNYEYSPHDTFHVLQVLTFGISPLLEKLLYRLWKQNYEFSPFSIQFAIDFFEVLFDTKENLSKQLRVLVVVMGNFKHPNLQKYSETFENLKSQYFCEFYKFFENKRESAFKKIMQQFTTTSFNLTAINYTTSNFTSVFTEAKKIKKINTKFE